MKKLMTAALMTTLLSGCVIHVGHSKEANITYEDHLALSSSGITTLIIDNGAGDIIVKGDELTDEINVDAYIRTDNKEKIEFSLERRGTKAYLIGSYQSGINMWNGNSPSVDLTISMPDNIAVVIDDGSGDVFMSEIKSDVTIDDGSGSIDLKHIKGNITIEDGSGSIDINNVIGNIDVEDGSGNISVDEVTGKVVIDDNSGSISVTNTGDTVVIEDGSGDILVKNTKGLTILDDGSGDLDIINIDGKVSID